MIALTIAQIAHAVSGELHLAPGATADTVISGAVDTDSRLIEAGGVFVAKPGEETDGHLFVDAAAGKGAALAIVERTVEAPVSQIVVADAVEALADLARDVVKRVKDAGDLRVVGITGSNGKTTTKNLLARILEGEGETVSPKASFNNEVGAPLTMLRVTASTRYLVSEFGASGPGAIARLAGLVDPDVAVVLMVGMAHAGGFGGIEGTFHAKSELVKSLRAGGVAVLNADDARVAAMAPIASEAGAGVRWFGRGQGATDVRADDVVVTASGTSFTVTADGVSLPLRLRVLGEHHVMNALAAIAAATTLGVSLADSAAALERFEGLKRRLETVGTAAGVTVIDDFGHNPDKIDATLASLRNSPGRLLIMFQPHGYGPLTKMGEELAASFAKGMAPGDKLYLPDPVYQGGTVERTRGSDWLAEQIRSLGGTAEHIPERAAIGEALLEQAHEGDRIVIMGARDDSLSEFAADLVERLAARN